MAFGTTTVSRADLQFTATTGPAKAGIEEVRRVFRQATSGMSDDALRLQGAQLRADDAIARSHGKVNRSTIAAELNLRKLALENTQAAGNARRASSAYNTEARDIERFGRGALVGSGALRGLGRAAFYASSYFLGGAGLIYAIKHSLDLAEQQSGILANLRNAVTDVGYSWDAYRGKIANVTEETKRLSAFDEDELYKSLQLLIRATGDVDKGLALNVTATNLARGTGKNLLAIAAAIAKAYDGQTGALRRLVPTIAAGVKGQQAIAQAGRQYANAAERYTRTAIGAQTDLTVAIQDTEKAIGRDLLPTAKRWELELSAWLDNTKNQKRIQHDVNQVITDAGKIIHGLVDAEKLIAPPIHAAISAMGGLEHAAETAFILAMLVKAKRAAGGLGLIQTASGRARTQIVADAAVEEKALAGVAAEAKITADAIAGVAAAWAGAAGAGAAAAAAGGGAAKGAVTAAEAGALAALAAKGGKVGLGIAGKALRVGVRGGELLLLVQAISDWNHQHDSKDTQTPGGIAHALGDTVTGFLGGKWINRDIGAAFGHTAKPSATGKLTWSDVWPLIKSGVLTVGAIRQLKGRFATAADYNGALAYAKQVGGPGGVNLPTSVSGTAVLPGHLSPAQQRAQALAENPNNLSALTTQRDYDVNAIAFLKKRFAAGKLPGADYISQLKALESDRDQQQSQIDSIHQDAARKRDAAARKATAAERARERKAAAAERARERKYRAGLSTEALHLRDQATQELRAETKGIGTHVVDGKVVGDAHFVEPTAQRKLIEFYKQEADDVKLSGAEQARYHHLYISELGKVDHEQETFDRKVTSVLKAARKKQADRLKEQQQLRDAILQNRLSAAQLAETQAGTNAAAIRRARKRELDVELAILGEEKKAGKGLTGLAKQQNIADQLATRTAIAQLRNQLTPAKADTGANERQFLSSFANIVRNFAPNAFPAKAGTHLYELVHETRRTNKHLSELNAGARFPNSRAAEVAVQAAFG